MELLIVVILIGLVTALAAPQISQAMANNKVTDATNRMLIIVRAARSKAAVDGSAMGVYLRATTDDQLIRLDRSDDNTCSGLPDCGDDPPYDRTSCGLEYIDFQESQWVRYGVRINLISTCTSADAIDPLRLCVQPSGHTFTQSGANWVRLDEPIDIAVDRTDNGTDPASVVRHVLVSASGMPRLAL